jgi:hypothetical protein
MTEKEMKMTMPVNPQNLSNFLSPLVDSANMISHELKGASRYVAFKKIKSVIDASDVCLGIWADASDPRGFDFLVVKGSGKLISILASGISTEVRVAAIPCKCAEQAIATRQSFDRLN